MCKNKLQKLKRQQLKLLSKKIELYNQYNILRYKPSSKQLSYHDLGAQYKERLFLAGNRCGKTFCGAQEMSIHLTGLYPKWWQGRRFDKPIRAWAGSVTAESTRDILQNAYLGDEDTFGAIPKDLILKKTYKKSVTDAVDFVYVRHVSGGVSKLGFKSYDQGREKFQGTSRHVIHLDEEPDLRLYEECLMRTMDCDGLIMLTMTPLKGMSDVCLHYLDEAASDKVYVQATWEDAPHLDKSEIEKMRKSLRTHEREAREKGVPSLGSGRVFPIKEEDVLIDKEHIPKDLPLAAGMDFGWHNPTAIVWGAYDKDADVLYIVDSYKASEKTPEQHALILKEKGLWIPVACDPAGQAVSQKDGESLMLAYEKQGVYLNKANNSVESGLMEMLERMRSGRLKIASHLTAWFDEFRLYRRNERGVIVKDNDHLMDASRYLVVSGLMLAKHKPCVKGKIIQRKLDWVTL